MITTCCSRPQEAVRILVEQGRQVREYPQPSWTLDKPFNVSYLEEARLRVGSRNQQRMQRINTAAERMQAAVIQNQEHTKHGHDLESQIHKIVSHAEELCASARKDFTRNRNHWLKETRDRGSNNPERDVSTRQRKRMIPIDRDEHRLIRHAFRAHGQTLPKPMEKTLVQGFNQEMA